MGYRLSELDQRVKLLHRVTSGDGAGGSKVDWSEYDEVWALVRPLTGAELQAADRIEARSTHLVVICNRDDVLESDLLRWRVRDGVWRDMNIRWIRDAGASSLFLPMHAELGVAN